MDFRDTSDFLDHINEHEEQEIMSNMQDIKEHFRWIPWSFTKEYLDKILKIVDKNTVLYELFKDEQRFSWWEEK